MPRAHRHYLPGYVWHITHRCHKKEFLLKFAHDQRRWMQWLFEAKKRFGTCILNYAVTSNHIHLIIKDSQSRDTIPQTMQLVAGRTGQEYNQRKGRKGAFWEDRYHATAVEADSHLIQCMVYVDLNMVRAGVVDHPGEWPFSGYNEIQNPRQRYAVIDYKSLIELFGFQSMDELKKEHRNWVEEAIEKRSHCERQSRWTESIAVGSEEFARGTKEKLRVKAVGRDIRGTNGSFEVREMVTPYGADFEGENEGLRQENTFYWDIFS